MIKNPLSIFSNYKFKYLKNDIPAGLSVAILALPQNMAYALVAGVDPIYGLYTSIISLLVSTFSGVSDYMIVGPTNITSLALYSNIHSLGVLNGLSYLQAVFLLTFLIGGLQFLAGILKLGNLVSYISQSVIIGLTSGVALIISVGQLDNFLGMSIENGVNIFHTLYNLMLNIPNVNLYAVLLGLITIFLIISIKKSPLKIPSYLVGIAIPMLMVYFFNLNESVEVVQDFSSSLPRFNMISLNFNLIGNFLSSAFSVAILGFIQVISIVKFLEKKSGQEVNINEEFMSQGIINMICSFFSSFVIAGSFTKSFANFAAGAKTRISGLFTALCFILFILLFNPIVSYIPISSLAGLVLVVAFSMFDIKEIKKSFRTTSFDAIVFSGTFLTTIIAPRIDYAIYLGILISIGLVLRDNSSIEYSHISYNKKEDGTFSRRKLKEVKEDDCIIINLSGELHFNASENLKQNLKRSFTKGKNFVIRMRNIESIDLTTIEELNKFIDKVTSNEGEVFLSGMEDNIFQALKKSGIIDKIGEENVYWAKKDYFSSTEKAIEKAFDEENDE